MSAVISLGVSTVATPSPRSVLGSHIHLLRDKTPFDTQEILEPPKVTGWSAFSGWKCVKVAIFIGFSLIFSPSLPEQNPDLSPRPPLPCGCQVARRQWQALVAAVFFYYYPNHISISIISYLHISIIFPRDKFEYHCASWLSTWVTSASAGAKGRLRMNKIREFYERFNNLFHGVSWYLIGYHILYIYCIWIYVVYTCIYIYIICYNIYICIR